MILQNTPKDFKWMRGCTVTPALFCCMLVAAAGSLTVTGQLDDAKCTVEDVTIVSTVGDNSRVDVDVACQTVIVWAVSCTSGQRGAN
jgi:hypothetical protein